MTWIKCSDRLPEPNTEFLAYARELFSSKFEIIKAVYIDRFKMKGRKPNFKFYECCNCTGYDFDYMNIEEVTHWMPLPERPKEMSDLIPMHVIPINFEKECEENGHLWTWFPNQNRRCLRCGLLEKIEK